MKYKNLFFLFPVIAAFAACAPGDGRLMTKSGYAYEVVTKGTGESITPGSMVFLNLTLAYKDSVLQSTSDSGQPAVLKIQENNSEYNDLAPMIDLVNTLRGGDSIHFYFPIDSFSQRPPGFDAMTGDVTYQIGITRVMTEADYQVYSDSIAAEMEKEMAMYREREAEVAAFVQTTLESFKKGDLNSQVQSTDSGLKYIIHEEGVDGTKTPPGQGVKVHYYGVLESDGTMFDNSFGRGSPLQFPLGVGQVIQGWDEGIGLLNKGGKATLIIPPPLGYGVAGAPPRIPENSTLVFYVEVMD